MKPVSPVIPGMNLPLTVFGEGQPEYQPLPALRCSDDARTVVSRWSMTWRERLMAFWNGYVYLSLMTFGKPIQPSMLTTEVPVNMAVQEKP